MNISNYSRRKFLGAASIGVAGSLVANPLSAHTIDTTNEYFLEPGMIYLNTGTLGPCRRDTMEATRKFWEELESIPLKFYGRWGAESLAQKTRITASEFLGCYVNEIMITSSTTSGMNAIAQGLRLKAGDRIITTDQEHGGGLLCWNYFAKYYGVAIDTI